MFNEYLITIDVDWSADPIIAEVANYLITNKIKSTWFITHDSQEIRKLFDHQDIFELGIHPNFSEASTQGKTPRDVMRHLQKIVPQAKSVRTHSLVQSSRLMKMLREEFNILYDVSLLLPYTPNIIPHEMFYSKNVALLRIPYFWEDDEEMCRPEPCFSLSSYKYHVDGIKIFDFHTIHIMLNSYSIENYYLCKSKVDITNCSLSELQNYINTSGKGTGTLFRELVQFNKKNGYQGSTISELASKWRSLNENSSHSKS